MLLQILRLHLSICHGLRSRAVLRHMSSVPRKKVCVRRSLNRKMSAQSQISCPSCALSPKGFRTPFSSPEYSLPRSNGFLDLLQQHSALAGCHHSAQEERRLTSVPGPADGHPGHKLPKVQRFCSDLQFGGSEYPDNLFKPHSARNSDLHPKMECPRAR